MKKLLLAIMMVGVLYVNAQNVFNEDFNYTASQALTANNWTQIGTVVTNPISVVSPGLTYTGFTNSGVGNAAALTTTGQDVYRDLQSGISSGDVYLSFMLNVSAAQANGDYFMAMVPAGSTSSFFSRLFAKSSSTGYVLGVSKWTETAIYGTSVLNFNTTYFVVVKYSFSATTTTDDQASVYVLSSGIPITEPSSTYVGPTAGTAADQANFSRLALRQGTASNAATLVIDGIRVSTNWATTSLPVQFKSFTATKGNDVVNLKWATASESNNKGFEIQRSINGAKYQTVGFVNGSGNSNVVKAYSFADSHETSGNICYRLKQIDFNGTTEFSKMACVNVLLDKSTAVFTTPNPFNGSLHIKYNSVTEGIAHIQIIDMLGKSHQNTNMIVNKGENTLTLDTDALPVGIYFIRVNIGNEVTTQRIVKR
jgi:hypothetical protein